MTEVSEENYERLRQILEKQNGKPYSLDDAKEIGNSLMDFYLLLCELAQE